MLSIRLRRTGARKDPHFRVVVADRAAGRDGPFIEILGHYHPRRQPEEIILDIDRVKSWVAQGAQLSDTVGSLMRRVEGGRSGVAAVKASPKVAPAEPVAEVGMAAEDNAAEASADAELSEAGAEAVESADSAESEQAGDDGEENADN